MVVFRNQRVEIDGGRSSPRTFEGGRFQVLSAPVHWPTADLLALKPTWSPEVVGQSDLELGFGSHE